MTDKTDETQGHQLPAIPEDAQKLFDRVEVDESPVSQGETPEQPQKPPEDWPKLARQYTDMGADMVQGIVVAKFQREDIVRYGPETRGKVAAALAPVLEKYNGVMPEWLKKIWPELFLVWTLAPIAYGTTLAIIHASKQSPQPAEGNDAPPA